ncbi:hypothetical protein MNBD_BACTEROID03-1226 [hydrothermal vent metagenome]|uniref:Uncharacterized protein n=1 Tax=hydrothermal vent metagenome TaxID=652676 RepID=A0A3B0SYE7_9ZZZZ
MDLGIRAETKIIFTACFIREISEIVKSETSFLVDNNVPSKSEHSVL